MRIKLSEAATEPLDAKGFWGAAVFMVVYGALYYAFETLAVRTPSLRQSGAFLLLNALWGLQIYGLGKGGWRTSRTMPWTVWSGMLGLSLLLSGTLWPHSSLSLSPVQNLAYLAIAVGPLTSFFRVVRKEPTKAAVTERIGDTPLGEEA